LVLIDLAPVLGLLLVLEFIIYLSSLTRWDVCGRHLKLYSSDSQSSREVPQGPSGGALGFYLCFIRLSVFCPYLLSFCVRVLPTFYHETKHFKHTDKMKGMIE
jgi:hypothetical protein